MITAEDIFETSFETLRITARYWLLGMATADPTYCRVLDAMEFMLEKHTGVRNGGDPEAIHQLRIFHSLCNHHNHLSRPQIKYAAAFLHDTVEDKNVSIKTIDRCFGGEIAEVVDLLSKEEMGVKRDANIYLPNIFAHEHASVVKLGDRNDNISTMVGVFSPERLLKYFAETRDEYLPRIAHARRKFPHQTPVFESMKLSLVNQLKLIQKVIELQNEVSALRADAATAKSTGPDRNAL